jgi:hypothetical protein
MPTDVLPLPFARRYVPAVRETPDPAVAAMPKLKRLRDTLRRANRVPTLLADRRFPPAPVFFFQSADDAAGTHDSLSTAAWASAASRDSAAVQAWTDLPGIAADLIPSLGHFVSVRHAARAIPGLVDTAKALAPHHPTASELVDFLSVADDVTVVAIVPAQCAGFRLRVRGLADVAQLHVLLATAITGNPAKGLLPGTRPEPGVVTAYTDGDPLEPPIARAKFQFYRPSGLRPDGTLPQGFSGVDDWIWGHEWVAQLPQVLGERVVLLAQPAFAAEWEATRRVPQVSGELTLSEVLSPNEVQSWMANHLGTWGTSRSIRRRAA